MQIWIALIAQYGIPAAFKIWEIMSKHFEANDAPTKEMWDELLTLENASHASFVEALSKPPVPPVT